MKKEQKNEGKKWLLVNHRLKMKVQVPEKDLELSQ